ncbi:plastocyanin/azurin family copper-binding protein [Haloarchaeobius amylolyticus]|uniref:plastocyanin/azurin family copper-binding protein n=1 Tax=Haloarchaeobius amylolyticus TaxID=1198296 RepID=UPI00227092A8|nr:plastocyanin/azurin family copper-binding protein [Haloarchaeobius amylolyticus]
MITDNDGSYFDPKGLLVEPGTTVRFVNDSGSHSTVAYHPDNGDQPLRIPEGATPWQSKAYSSTDAVFEHTFETEGVYDYYCTPHEMLGMVGRIVVGEPQGGPATTAPTDLPPAAKESFPSIDDILEKQRIAGP